MSAPITGYAELQAVSNFSFLRGAAHPEELVDTAAALGHHALAIADHNTLAGVVRGHVAARAHDLRYVVASRLDLVDGPSVLALPQDRAAYGRLSRLLSLGKRRATKGNCHLTHDDLAALGGGHHLLVLPPARPDAVFAGHLDRFSALFRGQCWLAGHLLYGGRDRAWLAHLAELARRHRAPLVATGAVHYHVPERRPLQDVLTCVRHHCTIDDAGYRLAANAERYLKPPAEMARLFRDYPAAVARTVEIADACRFSLDALRYEYPDELTAAGRDVQAELAHRAWQGAAWRYPDGLPAKVKVLIDHELNLIAKLDYAPYFLTVDDIVRFAREQGILCQGRGSAANSAVCYCLGITAVDPERADPLFERFVSEARDEPPDIDVDFEHERREEVIQYIYRKYGRARAGLAATVITYRARSAVREVGKAMGLTGDVVGHLASQVWGRSDSALDDTRIRELGLDPNDRRLRLTLNLTRQLIGFPRHLSQHVGGFVMTRGRLDELVPIENAAMAERTVVEWDKDDLDALGILKVDVLALGMLSCVRKAFDLLAQHYQRPLDLATVPAEDGAVYDMLCKGDSLGVFQVESRAQMAMLPRLKPRAFYDLVIQVAIVRPGPIQGDMVHPYLRRRAGLENVDYPSADLRGVLEKTLGVPLFQEQAMKIAIVAAGFTPAEADQLRRAMATFKKTGTIGHFRDKMISGMIGNGYDPDFAERCFQQIEGFGNYGFPESHAASFALLVYISSWLKCHYPAVFACALLNAQPMGFYAPAQIVRDARDHGVTVLPPCVNASQWDCTLEPAAGGLALRLGLRQIKGVKQDDAEILVACRGGGYRDPRDLWRRSGLSWNALEALARGDAYRGLGLDRRRAFWAVRGLAQAITGPAEARAGALPLFAAAEARDGRAVAQREAAVTLPATPLGEDVVDDYAALRLSLKAHPVSLLRADLAASGRVTTADLVRRPDGKRVRLAGLVLVRQRPGTAKGVIFITLEDETGAANIIVWPDVFEKHRRIVLGAKLLGITGRLQKADQVTHVIAEKLEDLSDRLALLTAAADTPAGDPADTIDGAFGGALAHADAVKRPYHEGRARPPRRIPPRAATPSAAPAAVPTPTHPRQVKPDLRVVSRDFH